MVRALQQGGGGAGLILGEERKRGHERKECSASIVVPSLLLDF